MTTRPMTGPRRGPATRDLPARLGDDGARFGPAAPAEFTSRVLASLPDAPRGLPVDEARRGRRRAGSMAAVLLLAGCAWAWSALPSGAAFEPPDLLAAAPTSTRGEWLAVTRPPALRGPTSPGSPPSNNPTGAAAPILAVDGPPAGRGGALPWPTLPTTSSLAPLAAADQSFRRELAAVSAEAAAVAEGLAVHAARPLMVLGHALLSRAVPR